MLLAQNDARRRKATNQVTDKPFHYAAVIIISETCPQNQRRSGLCRAIRTDEDQHHSEKLFGPVRRKQNKPSFNTSVTPASWCFQGRCFIKAPADQRRKKVSFCTENPFPCILLLKLMVEEINLPCL
ncbi:hypothetical protein CRENBAI_011301 [Crenichthys baileyi]|uniref:Uncharacterized protein n=1 Tax=Crenichthys baileyi TaxID=28760 RepID=A0AAV9QLQ3_9TELE